jgi:hypothetical protein
LRHGVLCSLSRMAVPMRFSTLGLDIRQ